MKQTSELMRYTRNNIFTLIRDLSVEQLNLIPDGFRNNIIWNLGHMIYTQQSMCYRLGGFAPKIDVAYFSRFTSGTTPDGPIGAEGVNYIKSVFLDILEDFEADLESNFFLNYQPWSLHDQLMVDNINDAMAVTAVHEGRHFGVITMLSKIV